MQTEKPSERDIRLMDRALREARTALAYGGAGVAALLASPDRIIGVACNTINETGDLTNPCRNGLTPRSQPGASGDG